MKYKETALCPICGMPLEKQGNVILDEMPMVKVRCPDCGYLGYFYDKKRSKFKNTAGENLHNDFSETRNVVLNRMDQVKPQITSSSDNESNQTNNENEAPARNKPSRLLTNVNLYPIFCRKILRFLSHLFHPRQSYDQKTR